ncbi:mortality factor 4-like protein 1 [Antechinus flavipes]|uniref:mortality factor 4-like protein 1 n=1 Tax=Antechinus flavipes TaxID=38775 RepID=UPI00223699D6|nr:mortality factor 4-like protein 1 [Antechinus flavipes]
MAPKQAPKPEFQEGERVLCFHGPLLYEAKCLKVATEDKQVRYLIHYSGWNKNWDEWVPDNRVLKYSEANLQKQRELQKANQEHQAEGRARGGGPGRRGGGAAASLQQKHVETLFQNIRITPSTSAAAGAAEAGAASAEASTSTSTGATVEAPAPGPGRKTRKSKQKTGGSGGSGDGGPGPSTAREPPQPLPRRRARGEPAAKGEAAAAAARADLQVQMPAELKPLLVRDWELVTKQKRLVGLPAAKSVDAILDEYVAFKKAQGRGDNVEYAADEVAGGIRAYFNVTLGTQLLYEGERPQYGELLAAHPDVPVSRLYGAPHLLRLFVRIGAMLAYTAFDDKSLALLFGYLHDFLQYLARDPAAFFDAGQYKDAAPEPSQRAA